MPCTCPQLTNKIVFVVSFVGNRGTFIRGYKAMVMDMEFLYHVGYILTSVLGLFAHELFYSILVRLGGAGQGQAAGASCQLLTVPEPQASCCWAGRSGFPVSSSAGPQPGLQGPDIYSWPHLPCTVGVQAWTLEPDHLGLHSQCGPS